MDFSDKSLSPNTRFGILNSTPSDYKRRSIAGEVTQEADENGGNFHKVRGLGFRNQGKETKNFNATTTSAISKKKILAEKNDAPFSDSYDLYDDITQQANAMVGSGHFDAHSPIMPLGSKVSESGDQNTISSDCFHLAPYDPLINYTSPRPEFLRYNPNRRKEILRRIEGEMRNKEEGSGDDSSSSSESKMISIEGSSLVQTSFQDKDVQERKEGISDANDDDTEEVEMEVRPWYSRIAWWLFLLLGVLLPYFFYISCMNYAPVRSVQEYGDLEGNYCMIHDGGIDQQAHDLNKFPGNFLGTSIGMSNECMDICRRELAYAIPCVEGEGSEENESFDGTELVTERDRGALVEDRTLNGVDLVAEAMSEEIGSSNEIEQEAYNIEENTKARTDSGSEKIEILGAESVGAYTIAQLLNESSLVSETELLAIDSSVGQDVQIDRCSSFEPEKDFGEEAQVMGEVVESLQVPQSKMALSTLSNNQKPEGPGISSDSVIELKWDRISLFASKYVFQMLYIFICLSTIIVFNGLHKYFTKFHKNSTPASHIPPALKPAIELALEKKSTLLVSAKEEAENKGSDSDAYKRHMAHTNDEHKKFIGVQPPTVELLMEFAVVEGNVSRACTGQKVRRGLDDSADESQFSQSQSKNPVKTNLSSSANKVHPSPSKSLLAPESNSTGNSTAQKLQRKKDAGDREEEVKVVTTPLRRSSRLRNRVTSP